MIGLWSEHARTFLLLLAAISAVFLSLPIFLAPLRWARVLGWTIPSHTDLAVYFGRCLGGIALVLNVVMLRASMTGEGIAVVFQLTLAVALMLTVVHIWGAVRRIQPISETIEIVFWAGLVLVTLLCWPGARPAAARLRGVWPIGISRAAQSAGPAGPTGHSLMPGRRGREAGGRGSARPRADGAVSPGARVESDAGPASGHSSIGWDPYQVWLYHIDRPRRQRNAVRR